jgi:hypothetical protein
MQSKSNQNPTQILPKPKLNQNQMETKSKNKSNLIPNKKYKQNHAYKKIM